MSGGDRSRRQAMIFGAGALAVAGGLGFAVRGLVGGAEDDFGALGRGIDDVVLTSSSGEVVRWGDRRGAPRAVFFGFTNCPVICPVTVYELTAAADQIGDLAADLRIDFVTVDPERDTPDTLRAYFQGFGPRVTGFTGMQGALGRIMRAFEVTATRVEADRGGYSYDHTATAFLVDQAGRVRDGVAFGTEPAIIAARMRALLNY